MKSLERQFARTRVRRRLRDCVTILCVLVAWSSASAETVRDNFESRTWGNNDGSVNWSGDWIEVDGDEPPPSPDDGNAQITNGGELHLDDRPNTNGEPSVARQVNLAGATTATLRFEFEARNNLELSDSVVVEISANGGSTWTTLEDFTGLDGAGQRLNGPTTSPHTQRQLPRSGSASTMAMVGAASVFASSTSRSNILSR